MIKILDITKFHVASILGYKDRNITKTLSTGDRELKFSYPKDGPNVEWLQLENYLQTEDDQFVMKRIAHNDEYNEYTAVLNVEELEEKKYISGYTATNQTLPDVMTDILDGTGWTVTYSGYTGGSKRRTIEITEPVSAWDILQKTLTRYRAEISIDSIDKVITICDRVGADRGAYMMDGVNLRKLTAEEDTYDWYTRIIPIGENGITIDNGGLNYVENYQYSTKARTYVWKDERYTDTAALMEDATDMLEDMSKPLKAYTADVVDLAAVNPDYSILEYDIGDTVLAVSQRTKIREKQRIVKMVVWPEAPEKNTVEISNASKSFAELMNEKINALES